MSTLSQLMSASHNLSSTASRFGEERVGGGRGVRLCFRQNDGRLLYSNEDITCKLINQIGKH